MKISHKARRELALIAFCLATLSLLLLLFFGKGGYLRVRDFQERLNNVRRENLKLRQENQSYREKIRKVQEDPAEIERIAREELNLAQPGDWIITLPTPTEENSSSQAPNPKP